MGGIKSSFSELNNNIYENQWGEEYKSSQTKAKFEYPC